ncbi:hypothetical protein BH23ACT6_BH23ACT6_17620 [soil metagenome]
MAGRLAFSHGNQSTDPSTETAAMQAVTAFLSPRGATVGEVWLQLWPRLAGRVRVRVRRLTETEGDYSPRSASTLPFRWFAQVAGENR